MDAKIAARRKAALALHVADTHQGQDRLTIKDPLFNLREIVKQLLLVEDHLSHSHKLCPDCIRKHLLTIEALAEEAETLDEAGIYKAGMEGLAEKTRQWIMDLVDGDAPPEVAQGIREIRKKLSPMVCDPRATAQRVAAVYLGRYACPH